MPVASETRQGVGGNMPLHLTLHGLNLSLRKISKALQVRINPSLDLRGPNVAIHDLTPSDVLIIAQVLEDWGATTPR